MSLLTRLMLVVLVALVPALGFQAYTEREARHIRLQLVEVEALRLLRLVSTEQERIIDGAEQALNAIAGSPIVQDNLPGLCQRLLDNVVHQSPRYNSALVIGLDGHPVCASGPFDRSTNLSDRPYFRQALLTGGTIVGNYMVGQRSGRPTIHMAKPFRNRDGVVAGVVAMALDLDWLGQQLARLPLPPDAVASIADRNGTILARRPDGARFVGQPIPAADHFSLEGDTTRIAQMTSLDGRQRIAAYSPPGAGPTGLRIWVGLDQDVTLAPLTQADRAGLMLIIAGGGLALLVTALLGARLIRRPVKRLLDAADRWRSGDLAARTGLRPDASEFGHLAASFDTMAAALQAREQALRTALESTSDSVMVLDRAWRFTYVNAHARAHLPHERNLVGQVVWEAFPTIADAPFSHAFRAAMESGVPTQVSGPSVVFNGHFEAHAYPSNDGLTLFFRDVTEEQRIAAALRQSEKLFRATFEQAAVGMAQVGLDGTWLRVNDKLCAITGYTRDDLLGSRFQDITHPDDLEADLAQMTALLAGTIPLETKEKRYLHKDGSVRWVTITASLLHDAEGRPERIIVVIEDITERRRIEAELQQSEQLFRAVFEQASVGIAVVAPDLTWLRVNDKICAITGYTRDELLACTVQDLTHPDDLHISRTLAAALLSGEKKNVTYEKRYLRKDGTVLWLSSSTSLLRDAEDRPKYFIGVAEDVTERKRIAAALEQSEQLFRAAFEQSAVGMGIATLENIWLRVNNKLCAITGYTRDEMLGHSALDITHPDDVAATHRQVEAVSAGVASLHKLEKRYLHKDGSVVWVNVTVSALHDPAGRPERLIGVVEDITERKRAQAALQESETRLRLAQEAAGIGIWEYDIAAKTLFWSAEQYRLHGLDPAAGPPTFQQWLDLVEPEDKASILYAEDTTETRERASRQIEFRIRRGSDGARRWLASLGRLVADDAGHPCRVVGVNFDITERRQAEENFRHATALLRAVGTCSPDPIYAKDTNGRFLFANPALLAVVGKTAGEVIGRTDADWHHDPAQAAAVMANDQRIIDTGCPEVIEETFDAAGLGTRVFRSAKAPLRMEDGSTPGVVVVSSDITQIKDTEAKLRRLTATLEARVQEEVAARQAAQWRAAHAERLQALGQLAGGIAHDFNNVLQAIAGASALIERRPDDEAGIRRLARLAIEATERGAAITGRLLAFGRRADLRAESLDAAALLTSLREMLVHTLGAAINVQIRLGGDLPPLLADKGQLETVLVNLATNARDAMPEGGQLILSAAAEIVSPGSPEHQAGLTPGRYVRLGVADTGIGMDAATLSRAAEPFFTTKPVGVGTGLGLSMAKGFAEQSGGELSIESQPGMGTTVRLWLPMAMSGRGGTTPPEGPAGTTGAGAARPLVSAWVLLVDDDELVRETIAAFLEEEGFRLLMAASGAEALALLAAGETVDVLVTDLSMPGMDGIALIRAAQQRRPDLPALLLTGYAQEDAVLAVNGALSGTFSLLRKPVRGRELVDRLRTLMAERTDAAR